VYTQAAEKVKAASAASRSGKIKSAAALAFVDGIAESAETHGSYDDGAATTNMYDTTPHHTTPHHNQQRTRSVITL